MFCDVEIILGLEMCANQKMENNYRLKMKLSLEFDGHFAMSLILERQ